MPDFRLEVMPSPPEGYHWRVIVDGVAVREGTAPTEAEAYAAAEQAQRQLQCASRH